MGYDGGYVGGKLFDKANSDATDSVIYSNLIGVRNASVWSIHLDITQDVATYAATVSLWATDKPNPSLADDTDWVEMTSAHGFTGMPGGNPAGGNYKDIADVGVAGARYYRVKIARTTGDATVDGWYIQKPAA